MKCTEVLNYNKRKKSVNCTTWVAQKEKLEKKDMNEPRYEWFNKII